jgi:Flp pilus assembly protein TadG
MNLKIKQFPQDISGVAATEVALMLPVLMVLMLGMIDIGNAIVLNKKTMTAASISADLLTRGVAVNSTEMQDALAAARMAIDPYDRTLFGLDVASVQFQGTNATPVIMWRQTFNMQPNPDIATVASGLGVMGEGVLIVTTRYTYRPVFSAVLTGDLDLQEVAVTRGRRSSFVAWE